MLKIGITGNIASGKSEVEKILKNLGYRVLCTDKVGHNLLENDPDTRARVWKLFQTYDRREIGEVIFKHPKLKAEIEGIIHPKVREEIKKFFSVNENELFAFASVPLLYEAQMQDLFDKVILVSAGEKKRLERILKRDGFTRHHAISRIKSQMREEQKTALADVVVKNEGNLDELKEEVKKALELLV